MQGKIYKITYPGDPHWYVGQTERGLDQRLREHLNVRKKYSSTFYKWLKRKNGRKVQITLIDTASNQSELDDKEDYHIDLSDPYCLNEFSGGKVSKGEDHLMAKLTKDQADEVSALYKTGKFLQHEIGKMFGVTGSNVSYITTGRSRSSENREPVKGVIPRNVLEAFERATKIRLYTSNHKEAKGKAIALALGYKTLSEQKTVRAIIRNAQSVDPNWDPKTKSFLDHSKIGQYPD